MFVALDFTIRSDIQAGYTGLQIRRITPASIFDGIEGWLDLRGIFKRGTIARYGRHQSNVMELPYRPLHPSALVFSFSLLRTFNGKHPIKNPRARSSPLVSTVTSSSETSWSLHYALIISFTSILCPRLFLPDKVESVTVGVFGASVKVFIAVVIKPPSEL
ncbi:uncharacterized protein ARMOST_13680 [Armillaria ostoyae]|uniref:Uncharacterized protein n=1 Tax=Armillaria ostoyae TaxID=47428 RepID=A0A284RNE8_ARMOS|nr:uncharacterized protein ARMOST_13680 [Armillaria ostoyae]